MTKPSPIAIIAVSIAALSILAFTINQELKNRKSATKDIGSTSKNSPVIAHIEAKNPPHGQPGHRHDLPDGAPLPTSAPVPVATSPNNEALNNTVSQTASEINANAAVNPPHGQPGHRCEIAVGAPLNSSPSPVTTAVTKSIDNTGKNPAHGEPGHRCDIAVGAPLNAIPAKTTTTNSTATTTTTAANVIKPITTNTTAANNTKGLNPAHGQPGHRCDIAVGAPLNSPAKTTNNTAAKSSSLNPSVFPNYNFPKNDSLSSTTSTTPKFEYDSTGAALNPAHGQPGHDCSIAVGKPLKK